MIYFYKYIFKNFDFVDVFLSINEKISFVTIINISIIHRNDIAKSMNEIKIFHDCKWIKSCETTWKILNLFFDEIKSSMNRLQMHLKNVQRVLFNFNDRVIENQFHQNEFLRQITLIVYFKMNALIKKTKKANESFFMNTTTLTRILNNISIKIYLFIEFDTNSSVFENFEKWKNASNACISLTSKLTNCFICDCCLLIE